MDERSHSHPGDFVTVLQEQKQRVMNALETKETIDAAPIIRGDEALTSEEFVTLVYELHHVHLPELQAAGLVAFDRHKASVARGSRFSETRPKLKRDTDR